MENKEREREKKKKKVRLIPVVWISESESFERTTANMWFVTEKMKDDHHDDRR